MIDDSCIGMRVKISDAGWFPDKFISDTGIIIGRDEKFIEPTWMIGFENGKKCSFYARHLELIDRRKVIPLPLPG